MTNEKHEIIKIQIKSNQIKSNQIKSNQIKSVASVAFLGNQLSLFKRG